MAIKLIDETERLVWVWPKDHSVKIYYRRVPDSMRKQWREEAGVDERGNPEFSEIGERALQYAILDWEGFEDKNGKPVPYSWKAFEAVPDGVRMPFVNVLLNGTKLDFAEERKIKNSDKSSGDGSS